MEAERALREAKAAEEARLKLLEEQWLKEKREAEEAAAIAKKEAEEAEKARL